MKYYLGIDGGGTKTVAAVSDEKGNILKKHIGKTVNFYSVGMETARKNLSEMIDGLNIASFESAFIGCSALDGKADEKLIEKLCGGIVNAKKIGMNSDIYIALKSVGECECPCVAVCGTGSMAAAEDSDGLIHIAGGWGHKIGDEGSAYAVALRALSLCGRMCDMGEKTPLLRCAESFFGVDDFRKAIDVIYSPETTKDVLAAFSEKVGCLASSGDDDAVKIIFFEAESFADTVLMLLNKVGFCCVLGLYGGMFQHNEIFRNAFSEKISKHYPHLDIKLIDIPPEESALTLARKL